MNRVNSAAEDSGSGHDNELIDGVSFSRLVEYLEQGRLPRDDAIESSASCLSVLEGLENLRVVTGRMVRQDLEKASEPNDEWLEAVMSGIKRDALGGRRIPIPSDNHSLDLGISEGSVRGAVRSAEKHFPGLIVGACRLEGDVTVHGEPIDVQLELSVPYGSDVQRLSEQVRAYVHDMLHEHTPLTVTAINIFVRDMHDFSEGESHA